MTDLYGIKPDLLECLIKSTIEPIRLGYRSTSLGYRYPSRYRLDDYLSGFLKDRDRSQLYYCDPMLQHISICRLILSLLDGINVLDVVYHDLSDYIVCHFYDHLCKATTDFLYEQNISDEHPASELLHFLETTAYNNLSRFNLGRPVMYSILQWENMLDCRSSLEGVAMSVSKVDIMGRVHHLTFKIYREMLRTTRDLDGTKNITIDGFDHVQFRTFYWIPWCGIDTVLSCEALDRMTMEGRIPFSFTNFITTQELSGPFYISPDIYHTRITEYSLLTIHERPFFKQNGSFMDHLSCSLPTEKIFDLLRQTILSGSIMRHCPEELVFDMLNVIIEWLERLGSDRPSDLYDIFQGELLRLKEKSPSTWIDRLSIINEYY